MYFEHCTGMNLSIFWWSSSNTVHILASKNRTHRGKSTTKTELLIEQTWTLFFWTSNGLKHVHLLESNWNTLFLASNEQPLNIVWLITSKFMWIAVASKLLKLSQKGCLDFDHCIVHVIWEMCWFCKFTFHTRLDSSPNAKHGAAARGASCSREHMESSVEVPQVVAGKQQLGQVKVQEPQLDILSCSYYQD